MLPPQGLFPARNVNSRTPAVFSGFFEAAHHVAGIYPPGSAATYKTAKSETAGRLD
jgi:hypothetical protein